MDLINLSTKKTLVPVRPQKQVLKRDISPRLKSNRVQTPGTAPGTATATATATKKDITLETLMNEDELLIRSNKMPDVSIKELQKFNDAQLTDATTEEKTIESKKKSIESRAAEIFKFIGSVPPECKVEFYHKTQNNEDE